MKNSTFTFVLSLLFATQGFCSWPAKTLSASEISRDPVGTLSEFLESAGEIDVSASDYRGLTLKFNQKTNQWDCSVPVAYYEESSWLSDGWEDKEKVGWSRRPGNGLENVHSDLGSLVGVLDEASIEVRRVSTVRINRESKKVRAIWNKLEFSIPKLRVAIIYPFMRDLFGDYRADTKVHIYIIEREAEGGAGEPAGKPGSEHVGDEKPQPVEK